VARSFDATLAVATSVQTATRISTTYIHSGPLATQRIGIEIADLRASALGYTAMRAELASTDPHKPLVEKQLLDLQDLQDLQALLNGNAQEALRIIDAAIDEVTNARGRVGAVQANAIEATADSLLVSYNNLSDSESRLRDTDYAWESAQYSRHQIIYQAATAMLAQANQVPQTVVQRLLQ
jgi:flagellin